MLKVLGRSNSINVKKVLWLCHELGLAYEHVEWGKEGLPLKSDDFLALNPNAKVPVIVDDGFVLWESNTICRYLAGCQQRIDLLPSDIRQRARVEQWMDWQATELNNAWRYAFMGLVRKSPEYRDAQEIAKSIESWNHHIRILDQAVAQTGAFVTGEAFTLADIVLGVAVHRWFMSPIERFDLPHVAAYYERLAQRPGYLLHGRNSVP
ncbi:glutathione S-transferase [uncultured Propionivibrio sp.]|uniref:glutathione S-transferase family protein n=1 Tax=uncultured Propionivibrio sp. TaxID=426737 RepID=UPI0029C07309|nr:glutathione S-transferase [uncultured Propionivibrio sp.]